MRDSVREKTTHNTPGAETPSGASSSFVHVFCCQSFCLHIYTSILVNPFQIMADDGFQTYRSKSSRKRKSDQMDVDDDDAQTDAKKVNFKPISSHDVQRQVRDWNNTKNAGTNCDRERPFFKCLFCFHLSLLFVLMFFFLLLVQHVGNKQNRHLVK